MKKRQGFVSNSSSCAFIITNHSDKPKTLVDFLDENPEIWEAYWRECSEDVEICGFDWHGFKKRELNKQSVLQSAAHCERPKPLEPGENYCTFADDAGILHEAVLHDMLTQVSSTNPSWSWRFEESFH